MASSLFPWLVRLSSSLWIYIFSWAWPDLLVWEFPPCFVLLLFLDISGSDKFSSGCNCLSLIQCPNMKFNCHLMTRVHFSPYQGFLSFIPLLEIFQRYNCFTLFPGYFSIWLACSLIVLLAVCSLCKMNHATKIAFALRHNLVI